MGTQKKGHRSSHKYSTRSNSANNSFITAAGKKYNIKYIIKCVLPVWDSASVSRLMLSQSRISARCRHRSWVQLLTSRQKWRAKGRGKDQKSATSWLDLWRNKTHYVTDAKHTVSKTHSPHWRGISYRNQHVECLHNALSLEIWYNSENKRFQWQSTILQVRPARSHESP